MHTPVPPWGWVLFHVVVFALLALDLGVLNRGSHVISIKKALGWTAAWVTLSLLFAAGIWRFIEPAKGLEFLSGYIIEYSLSVDNIFVFVLVFGYFKVKPEYQHRVLFWGIIGAFIMRAAMIFAGTALIHRFEWILYIFGVFLIYTGLRLAFGKDPEVDPGHNPAVNLLRRLMPVSRQYDGGHFFTRIDGKRAATPLLVVLVVVETTDLLFAVDSIPAIFSVVDSRDPFIIYTSNICAILGLRSLYFALAGVMDCFHFLKYGLAVVLSFVGTKMLLAHTAYKIPTGLSLGIIVGVLAIAVIASLLLPRHPEDRPAHLSPEEDEAAEASPEDAQQDTESVLS